MTIDCHAHWIPPLLAEALRRRRAAPRIVSTEDGERFFTYQGNRPFNAALSDLGSTARVDARLWRWRDAEVLSLAGLFGVDCLPVEESVPLVRIFNDAVVEAQREFPNAFLGLAALPLADIRLACAELERACMRGLRGAILPADGFRTVATAAPFMPLFEVGERLRAHFFRSPRSS